MSPVNNIHAHSDKSLHYLNSNKFRYRTMSNHHKSIDIIIDLSQTCFPGYVRK